MSFDSRILCVFEGEKREPKLFNSLRRAFFDSNDVYFCCYGNDIYELFDQVDEDDDLDIFELIQENNTVKSNAQLFNNFISDDFNQVFLFFDFECNDDKFDAQKLKNMLDKFDDETLHGKLFVSYPMIESVRDIPVGVDFHDHKVRIDQCTGVCYKKLSVHRNEYQDPRKITLELWKKMIYLSVEKANYMLSSQLGNYALVEQSDILEIQVDTMKTEEHVYVLCAFPMFVHHQKSETLNLS